MLLYRGCAYYFSWQSRYFVRHSTLRNLRKNIRKDKNLFRRRNETLSVMAGDVINFIISAPRHVIRMRRLFRNAFSGDNISRSRARMCIHTCIHIHTHVRYTKFLRSSCGPSYFAMSARKFDYPFPG